MIKILHVLPAIAPRYGGPSTAIRSLCDAQSRQDNIEIEVVATDADGASGIFNPKGYIDCCPVHLLPRSVSEQWKYSRGLGVWLRENVARFDLVHIHALWSYASGAAARAARKANVPYILRPAGMLSTYAFQHHGLKKRLYWQWVERQTVLHAAGFHATSTGESLDITSVRRDAKVFVIPNGVDKAAWDSPRKPDELRRRCNINSPDIPIVLFLSRLHPKKGVTDLLIPGFAMLKRPAHLAIAGGVDEHDPGYEKEVQTAIQQFKIGNRTTLLGPVLGTDRWGMFDGAACFILPSHSENFGIVVAEAMSRKCAVIVTDQVQCCEHVQAACAGITISRSAEAVAAALDQVLESPASCQAMGLNGAKYASEKFAWSGVADQVLGMYQSIIGK